ncbi:DNA-binding protein inhibitor ID-3 [Eucyclogobius newberryi]|uniref:DNA-binding protein inhibitor ID-3 n=1 Tax=Eucyclogobius newberryi TaxID=166745 RepID=UPI003B59D31B
MKALSPVRAVRSCYRSVCCVSEQSLSISRSSRSSGASSGASPGASPGASSGASPGASSGAALCDMNDCYSRLKALVPSIPQDTSVSPVEILQHVIDYICDLQVALDAEDTLRVKQVKQVKRQPISNQRSLSVGSEKSSCCSGQSVDNT